MNRRKFFKKSVIGSASLMTLNGFGNQKAWAFNKIDTKPAILVVRNHLQGNGPDGQYGILRPMRSNFLM